MNFDWAEEFYSSVYEALAPTVRLPTARNLMTQIAPSTYNKTMEEARAMLESLMGMQAVIRRMQSQASEQLQVHLELFTAEMELALSEDSAKRHKTIKRAVSAKEREMAASALARAKYGPSITMWRKRKSDIESLSDVARIEEKRLGSVVSDCRFHIQQISKGVRLQGGMGRKRNGGSDKTEVQDADDVIADAEGETRNLGNDALDKLLGKLSERSEGPG